MQKGFRMNRLSRVCTSLSRVLILLAIVCAPAVSRATTVATPTFGKAAGGYVGTQSVTLSDTTSGATIYYTTNGNTPSSTSTKYTAAISVSTSETIKAIAELTGNTNSAVATAAYTITVPTPTFSPAAGTYTSTQSVSINDSTSGTTCYYTLTAGTMGTTPTTSSTRYTGAISVAVTSVLESLCTFSGDTNSAPASATYTIPLSVAVSPATGTVSANGTQQFTATVVGSTNQAVNWTLSPTTGAGTISASGLYTAPNTVTTPQTVTITAASQANTSVKGTATLTLLATPTLTFTTIPAKTYGVAPFTVSASSASSGAITYSVTSGPATISGSTVTITGIGTVALGASQASTASYTAATASTSFAVSAATPTVTLTSTSGTYGTPLTLAATSTYLKSGVATATGQTISYALVSGPATLSNGVLTFTGIGSVVVTASVSATGDFGSATSAQATVTVGQGTPVITFTSTNTVAYGSTITVAATSTLGTPTFSEANGTGTATLSGSTLTPTGVGTVTITASVAATANYKAATATQTVTITKATPTLTFTTIPAKIYGVAPFAVSASSASSGAITYSVTSGPATISGSTVTITGVGTVVLGASQAATTNYAAATGSTSFAVSVATPTVTVTSTTGSYGTPLTLAATSTYLKSGVATATGQTISYALISGPATLSNGVLTFTGTGSVVVTASVSATGNFGAATSPQAPITVVIATPTPTFSLAAGNYPTAQTVTISDSNSGATIYYTLGNPGTTPTPSSTPYSGSITVSSDETLEAMAVFTGLAQSPTATAVYTIQAATPSFSLAQGSYVGAQTLTMSDSTNRSTMYYTTNGQGPTTSSSKYSSAITVSSSETVEAMATATGYSQSGTDTALYTITSVPAAPTFSLAAGNYSSAQLVTIGDLSLNATIYYTVTSGTTGTPPTTNSTVYIRGGAITVSSTETLEAIAVVTGYSSSAAATATYTLPAMANSTTALAVTSGGNPVTSVASGSLVTLTATVASGATAVKTGTVNFCDATVTYCTDIHLLGAAQLTSAGTAAISLRPGIGSYSYKAVFVGTSSFTSSTSSTAQLTVTGNYPTTATIIGTGSSAGDYTLTAEVTGMGTNSIAPTGTVSILDTSNGNAILGTGQLSGSSSGIAFANASTISFPGAQEFDSGITAVGDFNGDGKPDLAVLSSYPNGGVTILLGNGDGTFSPAKGSPITTFSNPVQTVSSPYSIAAGDFNGDGKLDLAVEDGYGYVTTLLGNGDGSFAVGTSQFSGCYAPVSLVVADFNRDGKLDLALPCTQTTYQTFVSNGVIILLGNGNGNFTEANGGPVVLNDGTPTWAAVGDFNGDGIPDLAVADDNSAENSVTILTGNGDGTFAPALGSPVAGGLNPFSLAVGDFDGSGHQDLAVADSYNYQVTILLGHGDATFLQTETVLVGNVPYAISVGDFNRDGIPDLAVANNYDGTITILLGAGNGAFSTSNTIAASNGPQDLQGIWDLNGPWSVAVGDFSGNSIPDLAWVSLAGTGTPGTVNILQTNLSGNLTATISGIAPTGGGTHNVAASYGGDSHFAASLSGTTPLTSVWITGMSPSSGPPGTVVTISGTNFGSYSSGDSLVAFNGVAMLVSSWTPTAIVATVPATSVTSGPIVVTAYNPANFTWIASNGALFTVLSVPGITSLSVTSGVVSTPVTITGTNFGTTPGTVTFSGTPATISNWTNTSIQTSVPTGATTGNVVVTEGGVASNGSQFTVLSAPGITSLSVTSGAVTTPVTITGTNFGTTTGTVTFNGTPATIINWTNTSIQTSVPTGATTGNVAVTAGGVASNGVAFTVLTVTLTSSANPSSNGSSVTFTATLFTSGLTASVPFMDSGNQIGVGTITGATATYTTSSLAVGTHSITASWPGNSTYPPITSSPVLQRVQNTPIVYSWPGASDITFGQTLASSQLIGGSAAVSGTFAWTAPGTIPTVGASTESVTFTPSDTTDYSNATGSVAVTVEPIESSGSSSGVTYTYDNLGRVYQAQYSTPSGTITVTYSYDSAGNRTSVVTQ
jgi:hypothetical protein